MKNMKGSPLTEYEVPRAREGKKKSKKKEDGGGGHRRRKKAAGVQPSYRRGKLLPYRFDNFRVDSVDEEVKGEGAGAKKEKFRMGSRKGRG